ncbi:hypothetical protein HQ545_04825 [Candidatus Woesearchaeota archaeon]|nr:hypothetical protein [Candidatus Woesearchaeota archaeon]
MDRDKKIEELVRCLDANGAYRTNRRKKAEMFYELVQEIDPELAEELPSVLEERVKEAELATILAEEEVSLEKTVEVSKIRAVGGLIKDEMYHLYIGWMPAEVQKRNALKYFGDEKKALSASYKSAKIGIGLGASIMAGTIYATEAVYGRDAAWVMIPFFSGLILCGAEGLRAWLIKSEKNACGSFSPAGIYMLGQDISKKVKVIAQNCSASYHEKLTQQRNEQIEPPKPIDALESPGPDGYLPGKSGG